MLREEINNALKIVQDGGIILYPTDTIWGIGCDASNAKAVQRIFNLKKRDEAKSMIILLDTANKLQGYVQDIPEIAYELIEFAEHPLTLILSKARNLAPNLIAADGSIGVRVVKHSFCVQLIQRLRKPLVSTSANISSQPAPASFADIDDEIMNGVDYVVDLEQSDYSKKKPSTIMKLESDGRFNFIRR
ncbi:MAG: L-threonylcarbamoyladenylate synthase [Sphingobacteriaceae bacterium]